MLLRQFPPPDEFIRMAQDCNVIPLCTEILADTETPVTLLRKIMSPDASGHEAASEDGRETVSAPVFLFESVEGGERWGRYSFLSASARAQVRVFRHHTILEENGAIRHLEHVGHPFQTLRELMRRYRPAQVDGLPRFWGGLVGYLTYETVSFLEKIPCRLPDDQPLAHFIVPDQLLVFDNIQHTLLAISLGFRDDTTSPEALYGETSDRLAQLINMIGRPLPDDDAIKVPSACDLMPVIDPKMFRDKVARVKAYIRSGDIIQAVISQAFNCPSAVSPFALYRAQRFVNPSPYLFFLNLDDTCLVGSSPETMVRLENGLATLRPIAGTRPRGRDEIEDRRLADELLGDEKERAEHLMLVDLGRNDLGRVAETGTVQVTDLMVVERYSHVMHLVSNITCDLRTDRDAWDLLGATFPAGTLSGAPKIRAMEIIAEMENQPRGPYGGAVGYVSFSGNMDMAITIRTACIEDGLLSVRAGAGIVADSDPEQERLETVNKAKAIQKALRLVHGNS
jgi:anthranilate synthase component 1